MPAPRRPRAGNSLWLNATTQLRLSCGHHPSLYLDPPIARHAHWHSCGTAALPHQASTPIHMHPLHHTGVASSHPGGGPRCVHGESSCGRTPRTGGGCRVCARPRPLGLAHAHSSSSRKARFQAQLDHAPVLWRVHCPHTRATHAHACVLAWPLS